jgi:hypothetical protein
MSFFLPAELHALGRGASGRAELESDGAEAVGREARARGSRRGRETCRGQSRRRGVLGGVTVRQNEGHAAVHLLVRSISCAFFFRDSWRRLILDWMN